MRSLSGETVGLPTGRSRKEPSKGKGQAGPMFFSCEVALRDFCPLSPPVFSYLPFSSYLSKFGANNFRRGTPPFDSRPKVSRAKLSCLTRGQPYPAIPAFGGLRVSVSPLFETGAIQNPVDAVLNVAPICSPHFVVCPFLAILSPNAASCCRF